MSLIIVSGTEVGVCRGIHLNWQRLKHGLVHESFANEILYHFLEIHSRTNLTFDGEF
jgi:hypothetical protein